MEIIFLNETENIRQYDPSVVAIGQFDGMHIAHLELVKRAKEVAKARNLKTGIVTFDPHPDYVLQKRKTDTYLTPLDEKIKVIGNLGLDYLFIIHFDEQVARMEPKAFVNRYLLSLGVKAVVAGFDYRYGFKGQGNVSTLKRDAQDLIDVEVISEIKYHDEKVGSALIRELLQKGEVEEVRRILGRYYQITGTVVSGNKIGRTLNLPTANLQIRDDFAEVKPGVYGVIVTVLGKRHLGLCNLGHNPSFNYQPVMQLETHIIDFHEEIYGEQITIDFVLRLRDEQKFASKEAFIEQIRKDKQEVENQMRNLI
jgi:riboflavin kinase/FMN adenylyltransferase